LRLALGEKWGRLAVNDYRAGRAPGAASIGHPESRILLSEPEKAAIKRNVSVVPIFPVMPNVRKYGE